MPRPASASSWHTSGIATWQDMLSKPFTVGCTGAGSQMETMPLMLDKLFGTKIKVIAGYVGGNDIYLAMERGEVQGRCGGLISSIRSTRPDWFPQKKVNVPIQIAERRNPMFPDVPAVGEFAKDDADQENSQARAGAVGNGSSDPGAARRAGRTRRRAAHGISCRHERSGFHRPSREGKSRDRRGERQLRSRRFSTTLLRCRRTSPRRRPPP